MQKKNKIFLSILSIFAFLIFTVAGYFVGIAIYRNGMLNQSDYSKLVGEAKKTVLFIGDGMGENHIKVSSTYFDKEMYMTSLSLHGKVSTFSNNMLGPTDSAAAASALATGKKYDNGEVSRHAGKDIQTISEYAKSIGLGVGVVTTDSLYGATPASFSSHASDRGDKDDIIQGQLNSNIDLFLGAGLTKYNEFQIQFENKGYTYVSEYSALAETSQKVFGVFDSVVSKDGTNATPTLEMLSTYAISYMEQNFENGYFLMIEGAHIDKRSHSNKIFEMMDYLNSFDESIKVVSNKLAGQTGTAVIVTADHETGGLNYSGQSKDKIRNSMYSTSGHTAKDVPYYISINTDEIDVSKVIKSKIDNTDIFRLTKALISNKG